LARKTRLARSKRKAARRQQRLKTQSREQKATAEAPAIGVIGGSGLYRIEGLEESKEIAVETPFGEPSDHLVSGRLFDRQVYFLPRHGKGHRLLPTEVNHRANIYALRSLNVRWIISIGAVGSLQEEYAPRDIVLPSQFFDRSSQRASSTFFGEGIVAHVGFADPTSSELRRLTSQAVSGLGYKVHDGGVYVQMDGPAFSTRAESEFYRRQGFAIIGMTNLPEAKLAREAEISLASMNFVTDYDCWRLEDEPVSAQAVIEHLAANAEAARKIIPKIVDQIPSEPSWPEHRALDSALVTDRKRWPESAVKKLDTILNRFL
jgi:5'-methylthioadenosine phosphorylase